MLEAEKKLNPVEIKFQQSDWAVHAKKGSELYSIYIGSSPKPKVDPDPEKTASLIRLYVERVKQIIESS